MRRQVTRLFADLFECQTQNGSITLRAPREADVLALCRALPQVSGTFTNCWNTAALLIEHSVDWPKWHRQHAETFSAMKAGRATFNPWEYSYHSITPTLSPIDFTEVYKSLHRLCGSLATTYFSCTWRDSRLIPFNSQTPTDEAQIFQSLAQCGAVLAGTSAPTDILISHSGREELTQCFRALAMKRPRKNIDSIALLTSLPDQCSVREALISAPLWNERIYFQCPDGVTWSQFQDFRILLVQMASDIAAQFTGFRVLEPR
jgi:hypothetical protein